MVKVRIINKTPVTVGHKVRLPGEVHDLHPALFLAAVKIYGAEAFQVLGAPPTGSEAAVEEETSGSNNEAEVETPEERPVRRRKGE